MPLILLASYPKSGNTWMRALLTNYLGGRAEPASINALVGFDVYSRWRFDELTGLPSSIMTDAEFLSCRSRYFALRAAEADVDAPVFVKTHEPQLRLSGGDLLFPEGAAAGAVYLVRSPLDVAVSYAHRLRSGIDAVIDHMADRDATLDLRSGRPRRRGHSVLMQCLGDWSGHVSSWLDQTAMPLLLVRYEELLADTAAVFERVVRFACPPPCPKRIGRSVRNSAFGRLSEQEKRGGFAERAQGGSHSFFREGRSGGWRELLTRSQVRRMVDAHGAAMARLGYLDEAERFLG